MMFNSLAPLPDTWLYIHEPAVKAGRIQCYSSWSPAMVPSNQTSSMGLEYFCDEEDEFWTQPDEALVQPARRELESLNLTRCDSLLDAFVVRCPKAYSVCDTGYTHHLQTLEDYLALITNLQCIGRNGMFKYNNMDHSMLSGLLAADNLCGSAKHDLWDINTDSQYHEQQRETANPHCAKKDGRFCFR